MWENTWNETVLVVNGKGIQRKYTQIYLNELCWLTRFHSASYERISSPHFRTLCISYEFGMLVSKHVLWWDRSKKVNLYEHEKENWIFQLMRFSLGRSLSLISDFLNCHGFNFRSCKSFLQSYWAFVKRGKQVRIANSRILRYEFWIDSKKNVNFSIFFSCWNPKISYALLLSNDCTIVENWNSITEVQSTELDGNYFTNWKMKLIHTLSFKFNWM